MGVVYLLGAGPGDPGLLTRRAARVLRRADIVFHDALVNPNTLRLAPAGCEFIDVGKRNGHCPVPQEQTNALLIEAAAHYHVVVRLKGGDPFIFGRGGEEALALRRAGVRCRVVPGITAGVGAGASTGIPLTHRDLASTVTLVTGYESAGGQQRVDWEQLARGSGTIVVYMGIRRVREITLQLIAGGRAPNTPAAVIESATLPEERAVIATLATLADEVDRAGLDSPAVIVIGEVVTIAKELRWHEHKGHAGGGPRLELQSRIERADLPARRVDTRSAALR